MTDYSESATSKRSTAVPFNGALATLQWVAILCSIAGIIMIIIGTAMNAQTGYLGTPKTDGLGFIVWGGSVLGTGVMSAFSLLIVNAVRWQEPSA